MSCLIQPIKRLNRATPWFRVLMCDSRGQVVYKGNVASSLGVFRTEEAARNHINQSGLKLRQR